MVNENFLKNLEYRINHKTCVHKIKAMNSKIVTDEMEHCRYSCINYNTGNCSRYVPVENFQIRIKGMKEYYNQTYV